MTLLITMGASQLARSNCALPWDNRDRQVMQRTLADPLPTRWVRGLSVGWTTRSDRVAANFCNRRENGSMIYRVFARAGGAMRDVTPEQGDFTRFLKPFGSRSASRGAAKRKRGRARDAALATVGCHRATTPFDYDKYMPKREE